MEPLLLKEAKLDKYLSLTQMTENQRAASQRLTTVQALGSGDLIYNLSETSFPDWKPGLQYRSYKIVMQSEKGSIWKVHNTVLST